MLRLICALLLLATLAGGVLYFQSDVFRTKADEEWKQWTKWTPENITKDPKGYLTFAIAELEKINKQLEAHKLDLTVRADLAEQKAKSENLSLKASVRTLDRLKGVYQVNEKTFPVSVDGERVSETSFQERVVEVDRLVAMYTENVERLEKHIAHLKGEVTRTEQEMKKLVEKRQYVQQRLDHLKLDQAIGNSNELTGKADEILATAKAVTEVKKKSRQEAIELVKEEENKLQSLTVKERFEQIMGSK